MFWKRKTKPSRPPSHYLATSRWDPEYHLPDRALQQGENGEDLFRYLGLMCGEEAKARHAADVALKRYELYQERVKFVQRQAHSMLGRDPWDISVTPEQLNAKVEGVKSSLEAAMSRDDSGKKIKRKDV